MIWNLFVLLLEPPSPRMIWHYPIGKLNGHTAFFLILNSVPLSNATSLQSIFVSTIYIDLYHRKFKSIYFYSLNVLFKVCLLKSIFYIFILFLIFRLFCSLVKIVMGSLKRRFFRKTKLQEERSEIPEKKIVIGGSFSKHCTMKAMHWGLHWEFSSLSDDTSCLPIGRPQWVKDTQKVVYLCVSQLIIWPTKFQITPWTMKLTKDYFFRRFLSWSLPTYSKYFYG